MTKSGIFQMTVIGVVAVMFMTLSGSGITNAHLIAESRMVNNAVLGTVQHEIEESFDGVKKSNVAVKNIGNLSAYIRVKLTPVWEYSDGRVSSLSAENTYDIKLNNKDWFLNTDGYYYCVKRVEPMMRSPVLVRSCTVKTNLGEKYKGMVLNLQVNAQSVQADRRQAVYEAWNMMTNDRGELVQN